MYFTAEKLFFHLSQFLDNSMGFIVHIEWSVQLATVPAQLDPDHHSGHVL